MVVLIPCVQSFQNPLTGVPRLFLAHDLETSPSLASILLLVVVMVFTWLVLSRARLPAMPRAAVSLGSESNDGCGSLSLLSQNNQT